MGEEALPEDNLPTVSDEKPAIEAVKYATPKISTEKKEIALQQV